MDRGAKIILNYAVIAAALLLLLGIYQSIGEYDEKDTVCTSDGYALSGVRNLTAEFSKCGPSE